MLVASNSFFRLAKMQGTKGQHSGHDSNHLRIEVVVFRVLHFGLVGWVRLGKPKMSVGWYSTYQMEES